MSWKQTLLSFAGVADEVTKKEQKRPGYKSEEGGKESPLKGEFTGDHFPSSGNPVKHEQSDWKSMSQKFKTDRSKGEPKPEPNKKDFGSPLVDKNQTGRAEAVKTKEEIGRGAEPKYVTGQRKPLLHLGARFGALNTDSTVTVNAVCVYGKLKSKVASGDITYLDPKGKNKPESDNMVVIAYRHSKDGKTYAAKVTDFLAAFASLDKMAKSPPHSEYTMHELKKNKDIDNPWAVAWDMKNKGKHLHDTKPKDKKKKKSTWRSLLQMFSADKVPPKGSDEFPTGGKGDKDSWTNEMLDVAEIMDKDCTRDKHYASRKFASFAEWFAANVHSPILAEEYQQYVHQAKQEGIEQVKSFHQWMIEYWEYKNEYVTGDEITASRKSQSYKEAFEGAAPPFGSPEREEWESGKSKKKDKPQSQSQTQQKDGQEKPDDTTKEAGVDFSQKPDGTINISVEGVPEVPVAGQTPIVPPADQNSAMPSTTPAATKGK